MSVSRKFILFIIILACSFQIQAQSLASLIESPKETGDRLYNQFSYVKAIEAYKIALEKSDSNTTLQLKIAEAYRKLNDPANASDWYAKSLGEGSEDSAIYLLHYAQALSAEKNYVEATKWYQLYKQRAVADGIADEQIEAILNQKKFYAKSSAITTSKTDFNIEGMDFSPAFYGEDILFVSARKKDRPIKADYNWDESEYLDLFIYRPEDKTVERFFKQVNTRYHEGPVVVYDSATKMLLTRNAFYKGKLSKSNEGVTKLQIFTTQKEKNKWTKPQPINLVNPEYSIGHPAVSADGQTLYFVSDMPGGQGGTDIYMSKSTRGQWQTPVNLGPNVNTSGNEMFPFLLNDEQLFFASNGHGGLGGLDLFGTDISSGFNAKVSNLGAPLNSSYDDFGLIADQLGRTGYFSSNREGSKNKDDIYQFSASKDLLSSYVVEGMVYDQMDKQPLPSATVKLLDENDELIASTGTNDQGGYSFSVEPDKSYRFTIQKEEYLAEKAEFNTFNSNNETWKKDFYLLKDFDFILEGVVTDKESGIKLDSLHVVLTDNFTGTTVLDMTTDEQGTFVYTPEDKKLNDRISYQIRLEKEGYLGKNIVYNAVLEQPGKIILTEKLNLGLDKIEVGTDIGKLINIQPIYFDLGKAAIRPDAAKELDKIVAVMEENPKMEIELGSHTDSRGGDAFNLKLSDKRAKASAAYIVSQGISEDRISGKGYGETSIINKCGNGVKCTEAEHELNRRTEFKVIGI